jgi:hypothetical protein
VLNDPHRKSGEEDVHEELEALRHFVVTLYAYVGNVTARAEALRLLLEKKGLFQPDEYREAFEHAVGQWQQFVEHDLKAYAGSQVLARLLRMPTGKPQ